MAKKTQASRDRANLTVGFHTATPPVIWRFDLDRNHSFALSLQGEEGDWDLGVTSPRGDFTAVAHFTAREDADEAFSEVEDALRRVSAGFWRRLGRGLIWILGMAIAIALSMAIYGTFLSNKSPSSLVSAPGEIRAGVPLSADDVLRAPPAAPEEK